MRFKPGLSIALALASGIAPSVSALIPLEAGEKLAARLAMTRPGPGRALRFFQLGDSHVAARPFVSGLRERLKAAFGDGGPGLVMPWAPQATTDQLTATASSGFRRHVLDWKGSLEGAGLSAAYIEAARRGETASVTASFASATIFHLERPGGGDAEIQVDGQSAGVISSSRASTEVGAFVWQSYGPPSSHRLTISTLDSRPVRLLGVHLETERSGITYGASGVNGAQVTFLARTPENHLRSMLKAQAPDVLLLSYGTNEARASGFEPTAYTDLLSGLIGKIRTAVPGAAVILTGPPAQELRLGTEDGATVPLLQTVISCQKEAARRSGAIFIDLEAAMGGRQTFRRWLSSSPALVRPDRVHYSAEGYDALARIVVSDLFWQLDRASGSAELHSRIRSAAERALTLATAPGKPPATETSSKRPLRAPASGSSGDLLAYRDASGRLVMTNSGAPQGAPVLKRVTPGP